MDTKAFKKLIKEAVREAVQEELKEILLEAVKAPKTVPVGVGGYGVPNQTITEVAMPMQPQAPAINARERYASLLNGMMDSRTGNINMTSNDAMAFGASQEYRPPVSANTVGEGSALPAGEVSLNQLMTLMNKK